MQKVELRRKVYLDRGRSRSLLNLEQMDTIPGDRDEDDDCRVKNTKLDVKSNFVNWTLNRKASDDDLEGITGIIVERSIRVSQ